MPNSLNAANQVLISITRYQKRGRNSDGEHITTNQTGTDMVYVDDGYVSMAGNSRTDLNALARDTLNTGGGTLTATMEFGVLDFHDIGAYAGYTNFKARNDRWMTLGQV